MISEVVSNIAKYGKLLSELPFSAGDGTRIIFRSEGRCYMTSKEADMADIHDEDIVDVTDHDQNQMLAATALMRSKDLTAMILCEPPYTEICIDSHHEIPAVLDDMAQIVGPSVRMVPADEEKIAKALTKATSVMIENSCLIAGGRTLYEAYTAVQIIEKSAETILKAQVIGGVKPMSARLSRYMHRKFQKSYSKEEVAFQTEEERRSTESDIIEDAREGFVEIERAAAFDEDTADSEIENTVAAGIAAADTAAKFTGREKRLREELVEYGNRLVETGLVQGTWGNISVMLDRETMLCTPSGLDYDRLTPEDMVRVNIKNLKAEGLHKPTSEKGMHAGIYREYPDANAVIHTHSKYCSIFAASEMPLQIESKEKMETLGEIIGVSRYALAGTSFITRNAIKAIKASPGCILAHHGMIAKGGSLEEAFENVKLIEEAAREYINRRWEK